MVSFNSTDGRKHRYLVMLANEGSAEKEPAKYRGRGERILPRTAMLYGCADKLKIRILQKQRATMEKQRATMVEEFREASHWIFRATMGSQRGTMVCWQRITETYFLVQISSNF